MLAFVSKTSVETLDITTKQVLFAIGFVIFIVIALLVIGFFYSNKSSNHDD